MSPKQDQLSHLPIGSVLLTYGDGPFPKGMAGVLLRLAYRQIRKHQKALYPQSDRTDAVHVQIKVSSYSWVSATVPRVIETEDPLGKAKRARIYLYSPIIPPASAGGTKGGVSAINGFSPAAQAAIARAARSYVGRPYDTLQLLGIATAEQKWIPKFLRHWLGTRLQLPGRKEVCSTLVHKSLLAGYKTDFVPLPAGGLQGGVQAPLGSQDPFDTCPADFENHPTFTLLAELS